MEFRFENEMANATVRWLTELGVSIRREFSLPWGICDLLGCDIDERRAQLRRTLKQRRPIGSQLRVAILSRIPDECKKRGITRSQLRKLFDGCLEQEDVDHEIDILINRNFVFETRTKSLQSRNGWKPLHNRLVAVEMKLQRVSDAFDQARCNLAIANESYVAFPLSVAQRVCDNRSAIPFQREGVGILGVNRSECRIMLECRPRPELTDGILQMHCVERFWQDFYVRQ